jgi:hypothetical protein
MKWALRNSSAASSEQRMASSEQRTANTLFELKADRKSFPLRALEKTDFLNKHK